MTRIAISGHRDLAGDATALIDHAIRDALSVYDGQSVTGVSCLAVGADQIFARAVLDRGGKLEVVVPGSTYRNELPASVRRNYDQLIGCAAAVHHLNQGDDDAGYMAASVYMLEHAHLLFAIWDGAPARGHGGTADVVAYARNHGVPVSVIWPEGAHRTG